MNPAKRKNTNWKQSLATFFVLTGTIILTACGGGGGGGGDSSSAPSTVSTPSPTADSTPSADQDPKGEIVEPTPTVEAPASTDASFARVNTEVLQAKCMMCHIDEGLADGTSLTYANPSSSTHEVVNYNVVMNYFDAADGNKEKYLQKAQGGAAHGGGAVINSSSAEYKLLNDWINSLETEETASVEVTTAPTARGFFKGVTLTSPEETLRRAALIFARRLPTDAEVAAVRKSGESALPGVLRGLMTGEGFANFVGDGANEVMLISGFEGHGLESGGLRILDHHQVQDRYPEALKIRLEWMNKYIDERGQNGENGEPGLWRFGQDSELSHMRQPLELFKYIITNERSYKEIVTADYTMVDSLLNRVYRSNVSGLPAYTVDKFETRETLRDQTSYVFKPGKDRGRVDMNGNYKFIEHEFIDETQSQRINVREVTAHDGFFYVPHSGVLTMPAFLQRYPSTATNRNRARARWTYKFFLGVDIEKSAPRTTDPEALADTHNPTMNNKNCTVCHQRMDPVAGSFQMYDDIGQLANNLKDKTLIDVLSEDYKGGDSPYKLGDTWYRDMRTPGFEGMYAPAGFNSLPWLGRNIAADPRFGKGTVMFWWKAVMGTNPVIAPQEMNDLDYNNQMALFNEQDRVMNELANDFMRNGYNAKDLFVAMAMTPFFRAESIANSNAIAANTNVGARRLLSVDEIEAKIERVVNMKFQGWNQGWGDGNAINPNTKLLASRYDFRVAAGGTDGTAVKDRAELATTVLANAAALATNSIAQPAVINDFNNNGPIFKGIDRNTTDPTKLKRKIVELYDRFLGEKVSINSLDVADAYSLLTMAAKERRDKNNTWACADVDCSWWRTEDQEGWKHHNQDDPKGMLYAWTDVVILLMTDYRFIHE